MDRPLKAGGAVARPKLQDQQRAHLAAAARRAIITHGLANVRIRDIAGTTVTRDQARQYLIGYASYATNTQLAPSVRPT